MQDQATLEAGEDLDAVLDDLEAGASALELKAYGAPTRRAGPAGGDALKQAVVQIGQEVLRQGQVIDRLAARPAATPATVKSAHDQKMRAWQTYQDLLARKGRHGHTSDPLTRGSLGRLDGVLDRMSALERRIHLAEAKRDRPPGFGGRHGAGARPARSKLGAYLASPSMTRYRAAVTHFLKTGAEVFNGQHITDIHRLATKDMHTELGPAGGYFMLPERDNSPLAVFLTELSPMRERATVRSIMTDEFEQPTVLSNAEAYWTAERAERVESEPPALGIDRQHTFQLEAEPLISTKLLDDATLDLEAWIVEQIGTAFAEKESPAWFTGTGLTQPKGLLTYDYVVDHSTWVHGKFRLIETGVSGGFLPLAPSASPPTYADSVLYDMVYSLKAGHRQNASWLLNRTSVAAIRRLRDIEGKTLWQPSAQLGQPASLLGYAVGEDEFMPDIGADTVAIGFGDWARTYQILDRIGVRVLRDPYTKKGWVKFYVTKRVGGAVRYFDAAVFLRFST
jgi:HK97 family phage major capsid protein